MPKRNKIKPGRKDHLIHELREENRELHERLAALEEMANKAATNRAATAKERPKGKTDPASKLDPTQPPAGMTRLSFHAATERVYIELFGGEALNDAIANTHAKLRAFKSQLGAEEWGGHGWGPTITPWEDRMTASALVKLQREKRKLLAEAQKEIHALQAEKEANPESESAANRAATNRAATARERPTSEPNPTSKPKPTAGTAVPRTGGTPVSPAPVSQAALSFTPDDAFKEAWLNWFKDPHSTDKPKGADEVLEKMRFHVENGLTPPPDLAEIGRYIYQRKDELEHLLARLDEENGKVQ